MTHPSHREEKGVYYSKTHNTHIHTHLTTKNQEQNVIKTPIKYYAISKTHLPHTPVHISYIHHNTPSTQQSLPSIYNNPAAPKNATTAAPAGTPYAPTAPPV
jgi:hypothetical protein